MFWIQLFDWMTMSSVFFHCPLVYFKFTSDLHLGTLKRMLDYSKDHYERFIVLTEPALYSLWRFQSFILSLPIKKSFILSWSVLMICSIYVNCTSWYSTISLLSIEHNNYFKGVLTKCQVYCYSRDTSRLSIVLKSKNEENEAYLSEIEVSFLVSYLDGIWWTILKLF